MKNIFSFFVASILTCGLFAQNCTNLFISEYVEGSYNNKAIELYNPTSEIIDLSNYSLSRYGNGSFIPSTTQLGGVIQPYSTYVIVVDKRDPNGTGYNIAIWNGYWNPLDELNNDIEYDVTEDLQSLADTFINPNFEINTMYFNGNDAITLETSSGDIIDIFGKIGENPGEAWGDENDTHWTKDQTLVRKASVTGGFLYDPTQPYSFDPTLEWDSLPQNTFTELGQHTCNCNNSETELILGCTDPNFLEFDPEATIDNNLCLTPIAIDNSYCDSINLNPILPLDSLWDDSVLLVNIETTYFSNYSIPYAGLMLIDAMGDTIALETMSTANNVYGIFYNMSETRELFIVNELVFPFTGELCVVEGLFAGMPNIVCSYPVMWLHDCENDTDSDGICDENENEGCTDETAFNYNPDATDDDGSCIEGIYGCTEYWADNYNEDANTDDGSCFTTVFGCIDNSAYNFNFLANTNDGSCLYYDSTDTLFYYDCNNLLYMDDTDYESFEIMQESFDEGVPAPYYDETDADVLEYVSSFFWQYTTDQPNGVATFDWDENTDPSVPDSAWYFTAYSWFMDPSIQADNWLGMGPVTIPNEGAVLKFHYRGAVSSWKDGFDLYITQDGMEPYNDVDPGVTDIAYSIEDEYPAAGSDTIWTEHTVSLNDFAGKSIYFTFHHSATDMERIMLDNFLIINYSINGCTSEWADNYNPDANEDDGSCELTACPYSQFIEYNPNYTIADASQCDIPAVEGCTNVIADNYNPEANIDNGNCIIFGCLNPEADNYNSEANTQDDSCELLGCMNQTADNYNPNATVHDGSCIIFGCTLDLFPNFNPLATNDDLSCDLLSDDIFGCTSVWADNYDNEANFDNGSCELTACPNPEFTEYNPNYTIADEGMCQNTINSCLDDDNDNYCNGDDEFPNNPSEWLDSDGDGIGDNSDEDNNPTECNFDSLLILIDSLNYVIESQYSTIYIDLVEGWNMIGYTNIQAQDLVGSFDEITEIIEIVKNNAGSVYLPEYNFNGIGDLIPGQGYQIKVTEDEFDFIFPSW